MAIGLDGFLIEGTIGQNELFGGIGLGKAGLVGAAQTDGAGVWGDRCRSARRQLLVAPGDVSGDDRVLRFEGAVLAIAVDLPDRHRGRGRNGADQLRRQCRRLYGPLCHMDSTGSFDNGLYALAGFMVLAAVVTVAGVQAPGRRPTHAALEATPAE